MKFVDFDIFPKLRNDFSRRTYSYFTAPLMQNIKIDESPPKVNNEGILDIENLPMLKILIDIELTSLPCPFVDFGIIDTYKELHSEAFSKVKLTSIDPKTNNCATTKAFSCSA